MAWSKSLEIDLNSAQNAAEQFANLNNALFQKRLLNGLTDMTNQLILLNERLEEAFETDIKLEDIS